MCSFGKWMLLSNYWMTIPGENKKRRVVSWLVSSQMAMAVILDVLLVLQRKGGTPSDLVGFQCSMANGLSTWTSVQTEPPPSPQVCVRTLDLMIPRVKGLWKLLMECYGLELECPLMAHVLKSWFLGRYCWVWWDLAADPFPGVHLRQGSCPFPSPLCFVVTGEQLHPLSTSDLDCCLPTGPEGQDTALLQNYESSVSFHLSCSQLLITQETLLFSFKHTELYAVTLPRAEALAIS